MSESALMFTQQIVAQPGGPARPTVGTARCSPGLGLALVLLLVLGGSPQARAAFTGDYNPYNWTLKPYGGDGTVDWLGDACLVDSGSMGTGAVSQTDLIVPVTRGGTIHFTWVFFGGTQAGYKLAKIRNNTVTTLVSRKDYAEGVGTFTASAGDIVGFRITSPPGEFPAILDISEFYAPGMEPQVLVQPQPTSACLGDVAIFSVVASNGADYQWQFKAKNIAEEVFEDLVLRAEPPADTGTYRVIVKNPLGSVTSQAVPLTIFSPPLVTNPPPVALNPCAGQSVTLSVGATGTGLVYQWTKDTIAIPGATGTSLTLPSVSGSQSGEYRVSVSNICGTVITAPVVLNVGLPPAIIGQPAGQSRYTGESATFGVLLAGSGPFQYQWRRHGTNLPGAILPTLTVPSVQISDTGPYAVAISNGCGSCVSSNAMLAVASEHVGIRIVRNAGRLFNIEVSGVVGRQYTLEVSTNSFDWIPTQTNWLVTSGSALFSDIADRDLRFYRVRAN